MRKYKSYKCDTCKRVYTDLAGWSRHMEKSHPEEIPQGYSPPRYFYYLKTGKTHSDCIICKKKTKWNEGSGKYERFCEDPKCKEKYREIFKQRMMSTYGKVHLLNDPEKQREMLSNRKISGKYTFVDGGSIGYVGKYEEDFLVMMDTMMEFRSNDIMSPSPHNYEYDYKNINDKENEGKKIYIPDFFIPSLNLEIEVKTHMNQHHKFQRVDRIKEECKDKAMSNIPNRNYIKIVDKDYSKFFEYLLELKSEIEDKEPKKVIVNESIIENTLKSDESVLESIMYYREGIVQEGLVLDIFSKLKDIVKPNFKDSLSSVKNLTGNLVNKYVSIDRSKKYITIKNINIKRLFAGITQTYGERSIVKLFIINYNSRDYAKFTKKKIPRGRMRIDSIKVPIFFALELSIIFDTLAKEYNMRAYKAIVRELYQSTWLSTSDETNVGELSLKNLSRIDTMTLLPHQKDFIKQFPILKAKLNLKGYINAFEQGLGKTLTAIALSECLDAKRVYIVCPNTLKTNWANEIRGYYSKYVKDKNLWKKEVVICDSKTPRSVSDAKFIITNNESIEMMLPYITDEKDNMFILDESHNFRNFGGKRVSQLFELVEKINSDNNLVMSGTPIKATPNEIVPALYVIDPTFTMEVAEIYNKCFNINTTTAMEIVQKRFGMIIYRKTKSELALPNKSIENLSYTLKDSTPYLISECRDEVIRLFHEKYNEKLKENDTLRTEFLSYVDKYSSAGSEDTNRYKKWINKNINTSANQYLHELDMVFMTSFVADHMIPNVKNAVELKRIAELDRIFIHMDRSAMGIAIGKVFPPRRNEMFINLYMENKDEIIEIIENNPMKIIIFSQFKQVIEAISKDLTSEGIKNVLITGDNANNRDKLVDEFHNDDEVQVLCATSQTMSTGVTLTEANKTFFFGPPWRSTDFEQASDRIHRIGQTSDVTIYLVSLDSGSKKNLSTRMMDILSWSQDMFDSAIKDDSDIDNTMVYESNNYIAEMLNMYYDDSLEISLESDIPNIYDAKKYPIYIVLMHSGTLLANVIQKSTGHEFSHACLAFNPKLDPLYSFGRKDMSMRETGFVKNNPQHEFFKKYKTKYAVYRLMVDKNSISKMKNRLGFFEENQNIFGYDVPGLVYNLVQKERELTNKYFCSRFVAEIINSGKILAKNPSLYKPNELGSLEDIELIARGEDFSKYKWR